MRCSVFILILVVFGCHRRAYTPYNFLDNQKRKQPFQVLAANAASTVSGQLKPLDIVDVNDLITLKSGHMILVHNSGKFIEFKGDTTISVRNLDDHLKLKYNLESHRLRPDISLLLATNRLPYRVMDGIYTQTLYINNIGGPGIDIAEPEDFCLTWTAFGKYHSQYEIILTNVFGEQIDTIYTVDTVVKMNLLKYRDKMIIAEVIVPNDSMYQSPQQGFRLAGKRQFLFPNQCDVSTPIQALEKAYHMDTHYYLVDQAQNYFELAADLSDEPIYDELLANYRSRRGK
ncbi:hypothetical protein RT717_03735 [Imperialibacter roseus]|uniref:Lipoprotein n=1 Tax=Imperialibacter roseus TaxID=1324217 RepID=A0ABZ0ITJ2_9BACT|nr:hypothetical protein [Imperialibacter roseus]WOK07723.1 hypothetical protein RT717_03680 [Imperialibacter roseus]WOK07734.1 hypothetical protein RT717_03735 [Imperialibacter roseus]